MLRVLDLFSGIGGFSLGLERTGGFQTVAFCEIEPFCRRVLAKHWPEVPCYDDVRTLTAARLAADGIAVDVICGGFPCQDLSEAGAQAGMDGTRSGLWSEIARLAGELQPRFVIVENVTGLLSGPDDRPGAWFGRVLGDLAALGYDAEWHCVPASAVGAPHERDRVWLVAYAQGVRHADGHDGADIGSPHRKEHPPTDAGCVVRGIPAWRWEAEPRLARVAHGVPDQLERGRALGNAVVPQIPELIGRAILAAEAA
jgi:DNA (cytosine-5)-methyltransferase 1